VLAFIPLTHSVFWGSMVYVLIGGTAIGTVLTLAFLPAPLRHLVPRERCGANRLHLPRGSYLSV